MSEIGNLTVGQAQACVMQYANPGEIENIPLEQSLGRVLAEDVHANRDLPPYDVSAMDGFAVRSIDLAAGGAELVVIGDIRAGELPKYTLAAGQCARIMTGAPVPSGADAVIRVEDTQTLVDGRIAFAASTEAGNDIRRRGEAMRRGEAVLRAGTPITPGVVGVLATVKCAQVPVYSCPRVAILSTGDELEALEAPFDADKIPESNSHAVMAQLQAQGIEPVRLGIARDTTEALAEHLKRGLDYDVLLVSGGSSVGVHDLVRPTLEALGVVIHFWRVEMRPGHPLVFGSRGRTLVFGLPGNPVSGMVCVEQFVIPAVRRMLGHRRIYRAAGLVRLAHEIRHRPGRTEFVRVRLERDATGNAQATTTGSQSSGDPKSMAYANGLLIVPAASAGLAVGETAFAQCLESGRFAEKSGFEEAGA